MDNLRVGGPKRNHKKGLAAQYKDTLRNEAVARQTKYEDLTFTEKIDKLDAGGFKAVKQRIKLHAANDQDYNDLLKSTASKLRS